MNINLMVLDLSHHEEVQDYHLVRASGIFGIIYKATQGTSFQDDTYWASRERAIAAGLLWGSYHFGDASDLNKQVENYLGFAKPRYDELICLDYEPNAGNTMGLPKAQAFMEAVESELGRPGQCVIYSGNLLKETLPPSNKDAFWPAHRLWLAQYGPNPVCPPQWDTFWLWQYTDGDVGPPPHTVQGIRGGIDCNSFNGTPEQLRASWTGANLDQPEQPAVVPEIVIIAPTGVKVTVKQP